MISAAQIARTPYKTAFFTTLLVASFLPAVLSVINYEITNQSVYAFTAIFSLLAVLGGAHVWLTLAYYLDKQWLSHFNQHPKEFYWAPLAIMLVTTALVTQPYKPLSLGVVIGTTFLNLWHHSKQNWGILTMIGKIRGGQISALRLPLIYAWPFFVAPWALMFPETKDFVGEKLLYNVALASVLAYVVFCAVSAWRGGFFKNSDPYIFLFGVALCAYFVPVLALKGKPYALTIWAVAHALQYYVMVAASLSLRERSNFDVKKSVAGAAFVVLVLAGLTLASWLTTQVTIGVDIWSAYLPRFIVGFVLGVNLIHFWLDRFIWKFSSRDVRELHGEAFVF